MTNPQEISALTDSFIAKIEEYFSGIWQMWDEVSLALFLLLFGWFFGKFLEKIVVKLSNRAWIARIAEKIGFTEALAKMEVKNSVGEVLGSFLLGFVFTQFVQFAAEILKITAISEFLDDFLHYIPKLLIAFVIVLLGVKIANTTASIIANGFKLIGSASGKILGGIFKGIIITFSVLSALVLLEIQPFLVNVLFIGFVTMIVIAGGIAFGLGGKETVENFLKDIRDDVEK